MSHRINPLLSHMSQRRRPPRKRTASGRAQRASARNQNGVTPAVPLESTSSADGLPQFHSGPSPLETDSLTGIVDDEPALSRSNSSLNLHDLPAPTPHGRIKRKDKGKGKEVDSAPVKVKEEPKNVFLPSPDPPTSNSVSRLGLAQNLTHRFLKLNNNDHCSSCRSNGDLVYCDGCPRAFHLWCLDPPIESIEEGDSRWFCPACVIRQVRRTSSSPLPLAHPSLATTRETTAFPPVPLDPSAEHIDSGRISVIRGYPNLLQRR